MSCLRKSPRVLALLALGASALLASAPADTRSAVLPKITGVEAPALARTSSTVLLLWDRFSGAGDGAAITYQIFEGGTLIGATRQLSSTPSRLDPGHNYQFLIRVLDQSGRTLAESAPIDAATKPLGRIFDVRDFQARGDGQHEDTAAIQRTIDACTPGGIVLVPPGDYLVNHLELKGNLTLDLMAGATLRLLGREVSQPVQGQVQVAQADGTRTVSYGALIAAVHADNLTITGEGTIDGDGPSWWTHLKEYRPRLLQIVASQNVFVQGISLQDPPKFNTLLSYVDHGVFSGLTFLKRTAKPSLNGDGLDPDSSRHLLIVGCNFGNQDDSISIKSGTVDDSATLRPGPSENIVIRDCHFDGTLAPGSHPLGISFGSGVSGGVRHILVKDCEFLNTASLANLRINRTSRYGLVEDVLFEHCTYSNTVFPDEPWNRAPISLDLFYYDRKDDNPDVTRALTPGTPFYRDIHFRNIVIKNPRGRAIYLSGLAEKPLQNISFTQVTAVAQTGLFARNLDGITLDRVDLTTAGGPALEWGKNVSHRRIAARELSKAPPAAAPN